MNIIHGASWADAQTPYEVALKNTQNSRTFREYLGRFLGYGAADLPKVMACTEQRVTLLGFGSLNDGEGSEFILPLPPSLESVTEKRRLTTTLAWLTPLKAELPRGSSLLRQRGTRSRQSEFPSTTQHNAVQHEILEGNDAALFGWREYLIKINCRSDAADIQDPIRYGLAVTLEVAEGHSDLPRDTRTSGHSGSQSISCMTIRATQQTCLT